MTVCQHRLERVSVVYRARQRGAGRAFVDDKGTGLIIVDQFTAGVANKLAQWRVADARHQKVTVNPEAIVRRRQLVDDNTACISQARPRDCF